MYIWQLYNYACVSSINLGRFLEPFVDNDLFAPTKKPILYMFIIISLCTEIHFFLLYLFFYTFYILCMMNFLKLGIACFVKLMTKSCTDSHVIEYNGASLYKYMVSFYLFLNNCFSCLVTYLRILC